MNIFHKSESSKKVGLKSFIMPRDGPLLKKFQKYGQIPKNIANQHKLVQGN